MSFPEIAPCPRVVMLHDRDHSDIQSLVVNTDITIPYSVWSFTDLLEGPSPLNGNLHNASSAADVLFVQEDLINPLTADAYLALCSINLIAPSGYKTRTYGFAGDYTLFYRRPSQIRELIQQGGWVPRKVEESSEAVQ